MTLILNADDTPLNVAPMFRAFNLVLKGKAAVVKHDPARPIKLDNYTCDRPTVIRLLRYVYIPYKKNLPITRENIYKRDGHACVYCDSTKKLTIDHVFPKSRGGKNTWMNLVTCCSKCNNKKDNKTPEEAGLKLLRKPYEPKSMEVVLVSFKANVHDDWLDYVRN